LTPGAEIKVSSNFAYIVFGIYLASVDMFDEVGMDAILKKEIKLQLP
jgi:hypothetical protein